MKLLKLPILVQMEVFKHLEPVEYFTMSLCSLNSKRAVRNVKYYNAEVWISELKETATFSIGHQGYQRNMCIIWFKMPVKTNSPVFQLKHNDNMLKILVKTYNTGPCFINLHPATSLHMFHQYICHLFGVSSTEVYSDILCDLDERHREMESLKIKRSILSGENTSLHWTELETFLGENPDQTYLEVTKNVDTFQIMGENLWNALEHMKVSNVIFRRTWELSKHYMFHFQGEHGYFENAQMIAVWVNMFLKDWKKRTEDKLRSMIFVATYEYDLNVTECFDGLITQKCSLAKRSVFPYQSIISKYHKMSIEYFNCQEGTEITRETDGKTMTIVISKKHVAFFVWPWSDL